MVRSRRISGSAQLISGVRVRTFVPWATGTTVASSPRASATTARQAVHVRLERNRASPPGRVPRKRRAHSPAVLICFPSLRGMVPSRRTVRRTALGLVRGAVGSFCSKSADTPRLSIDVHRRRTSDRTPRTILPGERRILRALRQDVVTPGRILPAQRAIARTARVDPPAPRTFFGTLRSSFRTVRKLFRTLRTSFLALRTHLFS